MSEKAKIAIRNIRKDANDKVKKLEKDKEVSEDDSKKGQTEVQKITDAAVTQIESTLATKEADILKV
jgi:ribosome recycling factor